MRHHLLSAVAILAVVPATAHAAGEPIMPLSDVRAGMHCTARSVLKGTAISTFSADVVDVVAGGRGGDPPYLLVKVSGGSVDATGVGPGFSGSPVTCPDAQGVMRIAGAISEGLGEYGNHTALATPIESILGEPVDPPAETRRVPALLRAARPLATPLSVSGLSPSVARLAQRAAARDGRVIYASPARPRAASFPPQALAPGSAMAVGLAGGDVTAGAIGTVAYVDGDRVWSFGHQLDGAGRRSLLLQDAYVYDVIDNPVASADLQTYKFAAPGHDLGTLTQDGMSAVVGRLGSLPARFPLKVVATDLDHGTVRSADITVADEAALGLPTGVSSLAQVGALAITQLGSATLDGMPLRQSGSMCVRIAVREAKAPLRFCNRYVGGTGDPEEGGGGALISDFGDAVSAVDAFNFGPLHITGVQVNMQLRRSLRLAYLLRVKSAPRRMRRGRTYTVTVVVQRQNGPRSSRRIRVHVPKGMPLGLRSLALTGTAPDGGTSSSALDALAAVLDLGGDGGDSPDPSGGTGPRTVAAVAEAVRAIHRESGVTAAFLPPGRPPADELPFGPEGVAQRPRTVVDDPELRLAGTVRRLVTVVS